MSGMWEVVTYTKEKIYMLFVMQKLGRLISFNNFTNSNLNQRRVLDPNDEATQKENAIFQAG